MKKLMMLTACAAFGISCYAQKVDASKVPAVVKTSFAKMYPSATNTKWEMEKGNYEAEFKNNGSMMSTVFKPDGTMTESEVEIKASELPVRVQSYVKEHYKGKQIKEGAKITKANGEINYEAEVNGIDVIFDANGNFLKEEKE